MMALRNFSSTSKCIIQREKERVKGTGCSQDFSGVLYQTLLCTHTLWEYAVSVGVKYILDVQLKFGSQFKQYLSLVITWWSTTSSQYNQLPVPLPLLCCHPTLTWMPLQGRLSSLEGYSWIYQIKFILKPAPLSCFGNLKMLSLSDM